MEMEQAQKKKYSEFKGQPRLPKFAVPKRYDLKLSPDLLTCKFSGTVDISLDVVSDTKFIVLNAADLAVDAKSVRFTPQNAFKVLEASEVELLEADEIMVVEFSEDLAIGTSGVLSIAFEGTLDEQMNGFYRSTYEHNGEKKNMAVTQFEPAFARRCFPCWDEPAFKAKFRITVEVPSDLVALSNMPVVEEIVHGSTKTVHYQESPIMSTYLVAVVVGLFDYIEDKTSDGVKVRVYCQVGKTHQGKFALDVAVKTLDLYKEYFAVTYPLPKLDMVVIPDFNTGAMENYGLVTYREQALLYDDKHSSASNKQMVAITVTHELAHQWFGNLVTMEWWTHLWLNEGFATWVSYLATDNLFPDWKIWTQFINDSTEGLRLDGLSESHPIEVEVNHAAEIHEIFDSISYMKGASVIRMLQSYLGAECFQRALASYVKKYACSNAKTEDLWAALEEESGEPVNKLMNSWTKQQGYPVVSVKVKDQTLELEQSQFLLSGSHGDGQWIVPITLCCGSYDARKNFLLQGKSDTVGIETGAWIKVNIDQAGFYRVKYDDTLMERLRHAIETKGLSAIDRYGILDDSYALCMACKEPLSSLLTLMGSYREEPEYTVISNLIKISYKISRIVADAAPELLVSVEQFFINLFRHSIERLGWDPKQGESHLDSMLRGELLAAMTHFGHDATLNEAKRRFDAFLKDRSSPLLPPDLQAAAYVAVMKNVSTSNRSDYESLLRMYRESNLSEDKTRILVSLASCPDPGIVLEVLNFLLTPEVRSQDVIFGIRVGIDGRETAWSWLKNNWEEISKRWGSGFLMRYAIGSIVSTFASYEKASEVQEFFASRTSPSIVRMLKQSIERININANWVQNIQNEKQQLIEVLKDLAQKSDIWNQ